MSGVAFFEGKKENNEKLFDKIYRSPADRSTSTNAMKRKHTHTHTPRVSIEGVRGNEADCFLIEIL